MQIVTKLPNGTTEVAQNGLEQPILPNSQLFQSFPTKVAQNYSEWSISPNLQLFQSFPTKVAQNDFEWPIRAKLLIPSHSELLQWEKIGKVANQAKLAIQSHFEPLW